MVGTFTPYLKRLPAEDAVALAFHSPKQRMIAERIHQHWPVSVKAARK
jgi:hypothetical protein